MTVCWAATGRLFQGSPACCQGSTTKDENDSPPPREAMKKLGGRASWRAITPANPCSMRLGGSLALSISACFEFFHPFREAVKELSECLEQVPPRTRGDFRGVAGNPH